MKSTATKLTTVYRELAAELRPEMAFAEVSKISANLTALENAQISAFSKKADRGAGICISRTSTLRLKYASWV